MKRVSQRRAVNSVHRRAQPKVEESKKVSKVEKSSSVQKDRRVSRKMEEEPPMQMDIDPEDDDYDGSSEDSEEMDPVTEKKQLSAKLADDTLDDLRPNKELYEAMRDRYNALVKELWQSQGKLEDFGFSPDEREEINKRAKLWIEYFVSVATFRKEDINLFEYMDSFTETEKFI